MQNKQFWVFRLMKGRSFIFQIIFVQTLIFLIVILFQVLANYLIIIFVKSIFYEKNFQLIEAKLVEPVMNNYNLQILKYAYLEQTIIKQNQNRNILFTEFLINSSVQGQDYLEDCLNQNYSAQYQLSHLCAFYYGEDEYLIKQKQIFSQFQLLQLFTDQVNENPYICALSSNFYAQMNRQYVNFTLQNVLDGSVIQIFEKDIENKYQYGSVMTYYNLTQYHLILGFMNFYTNSYVKQLTEIQSNKSIYILGITYDGYIAYAQNINPGCYLWNTSCMGFNNKTFGKMMNFIINNTKQSDCKLQLKNMLCVKDINDLEYGFYGVIPVFNVKAYFLILIRTNVIGEEINPLQSKLDDFYDENIRQIFTRLILLFLFFTMVSLMVFKLNVINKLKKLLIMVQANIKENQYNRLLLQLKLLENKSNLSQIEQLQLSYYNCVSQRFYSQSNNNNIIQKLLKQENYNKDFFLNLERRKFIQCCKVQIKCYLNNAK